MAVQADWANELSAVNHTASFENGNGTSAKVSPGSPTTHQPSVFSSNSIPDSQRSANDRKLELVHAAP